MKKFLSFLFVALLAVSLVSCVKEEEKPDPTPTPDPTPPITEGLGIVKNGDFSNGLDNWITWHNESQDVDVEFSAKDNNAIVDVKAQSVVLDNNWWDVQLKQSVSFTKLTSYTLKFTIKAENERMLMLNIQGGGMVKKAIDEELIKVTTTEVEHSINFFSKEDATNAELQFAFGSFQNVANVEESLHAVLGKIYVSKVDIVEGPALENQAPVIEGKNVLLRVGHEGFLRYQGITVADDRDNLTVQNITFNDITEGVKFDFDNPAVKGVYTFKYTIKDKEGLEGELIRVVTVANEFDLPNFNEAGENDVPVGWVMWHEETNGGLDITLNDKVVELDINKVTANGNPWENQFKVENLAAFKGSYVLRFTAKADVARPILVAMEGNGGVDLPNISKLYNLTTDYVTYELEFEVLTNAILANRNLQFWMGDLLGKEGILEGTNANALTKVYLKDVEIVLANTVLPRGWEVFNQDNKDLIRVTKEDDVVEVLINDIDGDDWTARLYTEEFSSAADKKHTIKFKIKADDARYIRLMFENAGFSNAYTHISVTKEWQEITLVYEARTAFENKMLQFAFGSLTNGRPTTDNLTFTEADDILTKVYIKDFTRTTEDLDKALGFDLNTTFTNALPTGWSTNGNTFDVNVASGVIEVDMKSIAANDWDATLKTNNLVLHAGETYTLKFKVKADHARVLRLMIENSALANAFDHINITTDWTEVTVVYHAIDDRGSVQLWFSFGSLTTVRGDSSYTNADDILTKVYIKELSVTRG